VHERVKKIGCCDFLCFALSIRSLFYVSFASSQHVAYLPYFSAVEIKTQPKKGSRRRAL